MTHAIANLSANSQTINNALVVAAAQTWSATNGGLVFNGAVSLQGNALALTGSSAIAMAGAISGTGSLVKSGTGTLTLSGANTYSGGTTVSGGTLRGNSTSLRSNIVNQATVRFDQVVSGTYAGVISGSGAVIKENAGTLTLTGANIYTGSTTISGGTLALGGANALHDSTAVSVGSGATLLLAAGAETVGSVTGTGNIHLGSYALTTGGTNASTTFGGSIGGTGSLIKTGTGTLTLGGTNSFTGATQITGGTLLLGAANALSDSTAVTVGSGAGLQLGAGAETVGSIAGGGRIELGGFKLTAGGTGGSTTFSGIITGTGGLEKIGAGTLTLTGANSYTGSTLLTAGTLALGANNVLPGTTALTISSGATLDVAGFTQTIASLNGTGEVAMGGGLLQAGALDANSTFGGTISGLGVLEKIGRGELVFDAALNFAGELRLTGGTVTLNGADVTLGTLRISGDTILDFGDSASVLSVANVIIENNATLLVKRWQSFQNFFYALGSFFGLNTSTNQTKPVTPGVSGVAPQNQIVFIGTTPNWTHWDTIDLQITPVPEPAAYGFVIVAGFLGLMAWWRRRNRSPAGRAPLELGERVPVRRGATNSLPVFATHSGGVRHATNRHTGRWLVPGMEGSHGQGIPGVYCRRFIGGATRLSRSSRAPRPQRRVGRGNF